MAHGRGATLTLGGVHGCSVLLPPGLAVPDGPESVADRKKEKPRRPSARQASRVQATPRVGGQSGLKYRASQSGVQGVEGSSKLSGLMSPVSWDLDPQGNERMVKENFEADPFEAATMSSGPSVRPSCRTTTPRGGRSLAR
jgi:hypothetical protein